MFGVYSIFDKKSGEYGQLFVARTPQVAFRMFQDGACRGDTIVAQHPEDFRCDCVGSFDENTGKIVGSVSLLAEAAVCVVVPETTSVEGANGR